MIRKIEKDKNVYVVYAIICFSGTKSYQGRLID